MKLRYLKSILQSRSSLLPSYCISVWMYKPFDFGDLRLFKTVDKIACYATL